MSVKSDASIIVCGQTEYRFARRNRSALTVLVGVPARKSVAGEREGDCRFAKRERLEGMCVRMRFAACWIGHVGSARLLTCVVAVVSQGVGVFAPYNIYRNNSAVFCQVEGVIGALVEVDSALSVRAYKISGEVFIFAYICNRSCRGGCSARRQSPAVEGVSGLSEAKAVNCVKCHRRIVRNFVVSAVSSVRNFRNFALSHSAVAVVPNRIGVVAPNGVEVEWCVEFI